MQVVTPAFNWLARHPIPTVIGIVLLAVALGSSWQYVGFGGFSTGVTPANLLLGATVVFMMAVFLLGMYIGVRIETGER